MRAAGQQYVDYTFPILNAKGCVALQNARVLPPSLLSVSSTQTSNVGRCVDGPIVKHTFLKLFVLKYLL